jgi:MoaE-MoaD fusion protein
VQKREGGLPYRSGRWAESWRYSPRMPIVCIACAAAHGDTGVFEAARYGIDRLKEIVPVWKKEMGPSGEEWVEGSYIPTPENE